MPIDAGDNGISLIELKTETIPYLIQTAFDSFSPTWQDATEENLRSGFLQCVSIAKNILNNEIRKAKADIEAEKILSKIYANAEDKRIIVLDRKYPYDQLQYYPEPIFVVYPRLGGTWGVEGVAVKKFSFEKRKNLPKAWAGLRDDEMGKISGVPDAIFCHRALFMAVARSKEGAIKLAQIAIES